MHAAKDLTSLCICANSSEPSLLAYAISTKILCSGSNEQALTYRYVIKVLITHAQNCSLNAHEKIALYVSRVKANARLHWFACLSVPWLAA